MRNILNNERSVLFSIFISTAITTFLYVNQPVADNQLLEITVEKVIIGLLSSLAFSAYVIGLIRMIRGKVKISQQPPYIDKELGVWGYLWRFFVVIWLASFTLVIAVFLPMQSTFGQIMLLAIFLISVPILILLVFGEQRTQKIKSIMMMVAGMPRI